MSNLYVLYFKPQTYSLWIRQCLHTSLRHYAFIQQTNRKYCEWFDWCYWRKTWCNVLLPWWIVYQAPTIGNHLPWCILCLFYVIQYIQYVNIGNMLCNIYYNSIGIGGSLYHCEVNMYSFKEWYSSFLISDLRTITLTLFKS